MAFCPHSVHRDKFNKFKLGSTRLRPGAHSRTQGQARTFSLPETNRVTNTMWLSRKGPSWPPYNWRLILDGVSQTAVIVWAHPGRHSHPFPTALPGCGTCRETGQVTRCRALETVCTSRSRESTRHTCGRRQMQSHVLESPPPREEGCHLCRVPFKSAPESGSEDQAWPMLSCHETKVIHRLQVCPWALGIV